MSIKYVGYRRNVHFSQRESIPLSRKRSLTGREYHPKICWYDSLYVILDLSWWLWTYRMREYFQIRDALHKLALFMVLQIPHFRKISTFPRCYDSLTQIEVYKKSSSHLSYTVIIYYLALSYRLKSSLTYSVWIRSLVVFAYSVWRKYHRTHLLFLKIDEKLFWWLKVVGNDIRFIFIQKLWI